MSQAPQKNELNNQLRKDIFKRICQNIDSMSDYLFFKNIYKLFYLKFIKIMYALRDPLHNSVCSPKPIFLSAVVIVEITFTI